MNFLRMTAVGAVVWGAAALARGADLVPVETALARLTLPIVTDSMVVSPEGGRVVFAMKAGEPAEKGGRVPVRYMVDGKGQGIFEILTPVMFSPDGGHLAWGGMKGGKWRLFVDEKEVVTGAESLPAGCVAFGTGGKVAWAWHDGDGFHVIQGEKAWPVVGASTLGMLAWSPDGEHLAALARVKGEWVLYVDGAGLPTPPAPVPANGNVTGGPRQLAHFSGYMWWPDSAGVVFRGAFGFSRWQVFSEGLDGTVAHASVPHENLLNGQPVMSKDGRHFAYGALDKGKWAVVTEGGSGPAVEALRADAMGWAGEEVVYLGQVLAAGKKQWQLFVNHVPVKEAVFDAVVEGAFLVSPDGKHYVCAGMSRGRAVVVRDGKVRGHEEVGGGTFAWSPDSGHVAYAAKSGGKWGMAVEGEVGATYAALGAAPAAWSADSARVAFCAQTGKEWRLVLGKEGTVQTKGYDGFLKGARVNWRPDGSVVAVAIAKNVATRIEVKGP